MKDFPLWQNNVAFYGQDDSFNSLYQDGITSPFLSSFWTSKETTDTNDVEQKNRNHIDKLKAQENTFIDILLHTDFEDGESNEATDFIYSSLEENSMPTSIWIADLFRKYSKNMDSFSTTITYGLLRIIAYLDNKDCFNYIKSVLILILESAIHSNIIYIQEAALMVIESWRDKDSYELIENYTFGESKYLETYSKALKTELSQEFQAS